MKAFVLVLASIFFAPVAFSQPGAPLSPVEKIKILSWNIYMLPSFLGQGKVPRAEAIGQLLASRDYDVIVFQEAFHKKARKKISRLLSPAYSFSAGPANRKVFSLKTNSGLWIFSRYPIRSTASIVFETHHGIDAFSRKGALLVELDVNGSAVQVIGTHLQNAGGTKWKKEQCLELFQKLLEKNQRPGVPQVICGDFNINKKQDESYSFMLNALEATDGELESGNQFSYDRVNNDLQVEAGPQQDLIDYILIRNNQAMILGDTRNIRILRSQWHPLHRDLSDHFSLEAELFFQSAQGIYTVSVLK